MSRKKNKKLHYNEDDERTLGEDILDFVKVFAISAIVILLFVNLVAHPVNVMGRSMDPTLKDGEYGFTSLIGVDKKNLERGDIVVVTMNDESGKESHWVKRIIGLPGETIEAKDGIVYIDGQPLDESAYLIQENIDEILAEYKEQSNGLDYGPFTFDFGPVTLADDEYWVMGDNRPWSKDSRYPDVGPVHADQIYGKGILVLWPFNKIGVK